MFAILIPAGLALWWLFGRKPNELTPAHEAVIAKAMSSTNAAAIHKVAVAFGSDGHGQVKRALLQRASLVGRDASELRVHQDALRDAITAPVRSGGCQYTREVADRLKRRGLTCTGKFLLDYALGLERGADIEPVYVELVAPDGSVEAAPGGSEALPPDVPPLAEQDVDMVIPPPIEQRQMFGNPPLQVGSMMPPLGTLVEEIPEAEAGGGEG